MELIYGANTLDVPPRWLFATHEHHGLEVVGVTQGCVTLRTAHKCWDIERGQVVTVPPYLPHGWSAEHNARLNVLHLIYTPRDLAQRLVPGYQPRLLTLSETQFTEYQTLFTRLSSIGDQAPHQQVRLLRAYLEAFLLTLLQEDQEPDPRRALIHQVAAYMQSHIDQVLTISEVAKRFLLAEVTLRRNFRAIFGISPKHYLLELRLSEAQHLLATTHLSIRDIGEQVGFFDLAHFSSAFRRVHNVSPSEWRSAHQQKVR